MLLKACPRCGKLIAYPRSYCEACAPIAEAERRERVAVRKGRGNAAYNRRRDPKYTRFYASPEWKRLSAARMNSAAYRCEECGALATEVHHLQPIQTDEGWERRLDWENLKALCLACHNKAHGRFQGRRKARR